MTTQISAFERNTFENQVIVITGAASGLGKASCQINPIPRRQLCYLVRV
jgi:short-subunit dehydrogenase